MLHLYRIAFVADNSPRTRILEVLAANKAEARKMWPKIKEAWKPLTVKLNDIIRVD